MTKPQTPEKLLDRVSRKSDVRRNSRAHAEISDMLRRHGLDVLFWTFECRRSSSCARATDDGGHETCPVFTLFFRRDEDFLAQEVDPNFGNWRDDWRSTTAVRQDLNEILGRHRYKADFVSPRTYVFLRSWEEMALDCLGRLRKPEVRQRIIETLPSGLAPQYVFWHSERLYFVVLQSEAAFQLALPYKEKLEHAAKTILSAADRKRYCSDHSVEMRLKHVEMKDLDLWGMSRED